MKLLLLLAVIFLFVGCAGSGSSGDTESIDADEGAQVSQSTVFEFCNQPQQASNSTSNEGESNDSESDQQSGCSGPVQIATDGGVIVNVQNVDVATLDEDLISRVVVPPFGCEQVGDLSICAEPSGSECFAVQPGFVCS